MASCSSTRIGCSYGLLTVALVTAVAPTGAAAASDDGPWTQQAARPTSWGLEGVAFVSPTHGFICGDDLVLMETTDGGETWAQVADVPRQRAWSEDPFHGMDSVGPDHIWAVGNRAYRSTDAGQNWQTMPLGGTWYDIDMLSTSVGYARSSFSIHKTTDGGATWNEVFPPAGISDRANSMAWLDEDNGVVWGGSEFGNLTLGLYRTTNGGQTWSFVREGFFAKLAFIAPQTILFARGLAVHKSTDGGATDSVVLNEPGFQYDAIVCIHAIDASSVIAVDNRHRIWVSDDRGDTWALAHERLGTWWQYPEPDISFANSDDGWLAGESGIVLRTTDGGHSWTQQSSGHGERLVEVEMFPSGHGVALGDRGLILTTEDFGRQWTIQKQLVPVDFTWGTLMFDLQMLDEQTGFCVGDLGTFFRTDDGGYTWTQLGHDDLPGGQWDTVSFVDASLGFIGGPAIRKTTDGGQNWQNPLVSQQLLGIIDIVQHDAQNGIVLTFLDTFAISDDGWQTYEHVEPTLPDNLECIGFANRDVGWAAGKRGLVIKTTNGGYIWNLQTLPNASTTDIFDIEVLSEQEAYLIGFGGGTHDDFVAVFHTTDGGQNWQRINALTVNPDGDFTSAYGGDVLPTGEVWTVGFEGFILASDPPQSQQAPLADFAFAFGAHVSGGIAELSSGDDTYLRGRSQFGFSAAEPNIIDLVTGFTSPLGSPNALDFAIEARLNNPGGSAKVRIRNWNSRAFEQVGAFTTSQQDTVHAINGIDPAARIRASDNRIEISTRISVIATFSAAGFDAWFDQAAVIAR